MTHELKVWPEYFGQLQQHVKTCEIRKNDRAFKKGDVLVLYEYFPTKKTYSGRFVTRVVSLVTSEVECFGLKPGYVLLSLL